MKRPIDALKIGLIVLLLGGCVREEPQISFRNNVQPILRSHCLECHSPPDGEGYVKTGLSLATYEDLMHGTIYGSVIVSGDSQHSIFNMLVEGRAGPSMRMPHGRTPLNTGEIEILRLWVEQGALNN